MRGGRRNGDGVKPKKTFVVLSTSKGVIPKQREETKETNGHNEVVRSDSDSTNDKEAAESGFNEAANNGLAVFVERNNQRMDHMEENIWQQSR